MLIACDRQIADRLQRPFHLKWAQMFGMGRRRLTDVPALAAALLLSCTPPQPQQTDLPALAEPRLQGFSRAAREQIETLYRKAVAHPNSSESIGRLGMALHAFEQFDQAEICYQRAVDLASNSFRWTYYLATVQASLGKTQAAVHTFQRALGLKPGDLSARLRRAGLLADMGQTDQAQKILLQLLDNHGETPGVHYRFGQLVGNDDPDAAARHFRRVIELAPEHREGHYALAQAYRQLGSVEASKKHLALYRASGPVTRRDYEDPLMDEVDRQRTATAQHSFDQGMQMESKGKLPEAAQAYHAALAQSPRYLQAHVNLIGVYGQLGDVAMATEHYEQSTEINPHMEEAHYNYGVLLLTNERHEEAVRAFQKALETNPYSAATHSNLGAALEQTQRPLEAQKHYRLALENEPNFRLANYHLGRFLAMRGHYREAISHLEKTLSPEDDNTPRFLFLLGQVYRRAGEGQRAADTTRRARELADQFGKTDLVAAIDRAMLQ